MIPTTNQLHEQAEEALRAILADVINPHVRWGTEGAPLVIDRTTERIMREVGCRIALVTALEVGAGMSEHVGAVFASLEELHEHLFGAADIAKVSVEDINQRLELPDELMFKEPAPQHFSLEVQDGDMGSEDSF